MTEQAIIDYKKQLKKLKDTQNKIEDFVKTADIEEINNFLSDKDKIEIFKQITII